MKNLIDLQNVSYDVYDQKIIDNVTLSINAQTKMSIIGPNGAGKTTLVQLILKILLPTHGDVTHDSSAKIGYCPQKIQFNNFLKISVDEFLKTIRQIENFDEAVSLTHVHHLLKKDLHKLSGGEIQRVLLCRALLHSPNVLILDEPTQGMDIVSQDNFYEMLDFVTTSKNIGYVMVSHDLNYVSKITQHVVCLNHHICCEGAPDDVYQHAEYVKIFGAKKHVPYKHYTHHHDHAHDDHECK